MKSPAARTKTGFVASRESIQSGSNAEHSKSRFRGLVGSNCRRAAIDSVDANNSINRRHSRFAADCRDAPTCDEIAAADQSQTEISQPPAEALLKQWAAEEDTRARVDPVQDAPVQVVQDAPVQVRPVQNARAEIRPERNRAKARGSKMHGYRTLPYQTPEHRTSLCKMPCKASVGATRYSRELTLSKPPWFARLRLEQTCSPHDP
ncbi:hypothetical protein V1279_005103 [Bradyrhizobium sp. AZCC 1610]